MSFVRHIIIVCLIFFTLNLNAATTDNNSFVALSDIHFDPFHSCQPGVACPLVTELRKADASQWAALLEKYDKGPVSTYHSDTNYPLLKSALKASHQQAQQNAAKFVVVAGDFLGHRFKEKYQFYTKDTSQVGYQLFIKKTLEFLQQQLQKNFANLSIYPVVGNSDTYNDDYIMVPKGDFFKDIKTVWLPLLRENPGTFKKTFPMAGYYAVTPLNELKLRLIILNSVIFMQQTENVSTKIAARKELDWLKAQLQMAEKNQQKVLLIFHVPVGVDSFKTAKDTGGNIISFWLPVYTKEFLGLLKQYHTAINGVISGHIHMEIFQILNAKKHPVFNTTVPSISPVYGNNPGFKIYKYEPKTLILQNYTTYYLDEQHETKWKLEYSFNESYKPNCPNCNLIMSMENLKPDDNLALLYQQYYSLSSNQVSFIKEK